MSSKSWESSCVVGVLLLTPCSPFREIIVQGWSCGCAQILLVPGAGKLETDTSPPVFLVWFLASHVL